MYKIISQSFAGLKNNPYFHNYFLIPFYSGITGFASFLFIVIIFEYFLQITGITDSSGIGITEIMIACLGFVLQFVYSLLRTLIER